MSNDDSGGDPRDDGPEQEPERPQNPFEALFGGLWPGGLPTGGPGTGQGGTPEGLDPAAMLEHLRQQMQRMSGSSSEGPIDWNLAEQMAAAEIRQAGDASLTATERSEIDDAVRLAEHWLDEVTALPSGAVSAVAWNRADWLKQTLPNWRAVLEPVAEHVVRALGSALPAELEQLSGPFGELMQRAGGMMFGVQVGQGLGRLATEVYGATDIGIPLGTAGQPALVPANVAKFGEGLRLPAEDVRLYIALREAAHQRLVHAAPWLPAHLLAAVEEYGRGLQVDVARLESGVEGLDLNNPEALSEALSSGLLTPQETPRQKAALVRLETALALVEGWVEDVVTQAAGPRMPSAGQLQEAIRRRRAEGGPAEQTFGTLVGLELRPRRLRDAAALWAALRNARGADARDALWAHPDLLPTTEDLDDPLGFVEASGSTVPLDIAELENLLPHDPDDSGDADEPDGSGHGDDPDDPGPRT